MEQKGSANRALFFLFRFECTRPIYLGPKV